MPLPGTSRRGRLRQGQIHCRDSRGRAGCAADRHRARAGRLACHGEAAIRKGLKNVFFVSLDAANIDQFFADDEIDLLYINFATHGRAKKNAKRRRLTYHAFLEKYKKVLKLGGQIHFKTDNANLFAWSLPEMEELFPTAECHRRSARTACQRLTGRENYALGTPIHRVEAVVTTKQPRPADEKPEPGRTHEKQTNLHNADTAGKGLNFRSA